MKLVLDTNVFISGVFFSGPPHQILQAWRDGKIQLLVSPEILEEYRRVGETLAEHFPGVDLQPILDLLTTNAELVLSPPLPEPLCSDPDDDKSFACALAGNAKLIISGDRHLLKVSGYRGIRVFRPRKLLDDYFQKNSRG